MNSFRSRVARVTVTVLTSVVLAMPATGYAARLDEKPSALRMTGDAIFARPVMLLITVVGAATFVVSLPFSVFGKNVDQAANTLVVEPAKQTFFRCLGCVDRLTDEEILPPQAGQ